MDTAVLVIFGLVYLGMILGELPGLALDRTGVALLGAIGVVVLGRAPLAHAWAAVDLPTIYLLFAMIVISAQFRLAGFYTRVVRQLVAARVCVERAGNDATAPERDPSAGRRHSGPFQHAGRQPIHRRLDRQHHRRHQRARLRREHRLSDSPEERRARHAGPLGGGGSVAGAPSLAFSSTGTKILSCLYLEFS
jgi:hypothetical protein